ncbi:TPA: hypothetical protein PXF07_000358 [Mannheimia haemolytica]|uniref:Uncharacterized protein n=1 Tax=Mannheimia haemolytica TaxID=75985 RepID=A0A248ZXD1_MANHA|nr:hypothetical protein [Mannheimia haemolytica]AWW70727.1 hypothetical protein C4O86_02525 [Pasteurellaceae bacterium 12565]AGI31807.1 hypothetical protein D650_5370 [Mannheimia haemolytica USDA-ARS-USMARC-183]AGI36087.1 hypothetical protein D648_20840 [Mannheimia haemolytica USDA-ARS-USMARC-185]AGK00556.1 hypothetical protein MHH_c00450 [Mannheimia haemolytica M42548]AGQ25424.1 hypothetical protein F382_05370 [Mannheimia haemolytica D153]
MLFKEQGYDEFLAEQIKAGQEAIARGETFTKEQINNELNHLFADMQKRQQLRENENLFEVNYA